jgi:uncharacterized protein (TIGR00369 family)
MPPEVPDGPGAGHWRALERLYATAAVNRHYESAMHIPESGVCLIRFDVGEDLYHAAGAIHGSAYFKMLDDAAFYAANSLVPDRFLLTTAFNLFFTRPLKAGPVVAEGRWVSGRKRVYVAEARLIDGDGEEAARGTGTFMRSPIALDTLAGYRAL